MQKQHLGTPVYEHLNGSTRAFACYYYAGVRVHFHLKTRKFTAQRTGLPSAALVYVELEVKGMPNLQ